VKLNYSFRFLFKNSGILHEDDFVQVGIKSEFNDHLGKRPVTIMRFKGTFKYYMTLRDGFAQTVRVPSFGGLGG